MYMNSSIVLYLLEIELKLENKKTAIIYKFGRTGGIRKEKVKSVVTRSNTKRFVYKKRKLSSRINELTRDMKKGIFENVKVSDVRIRCISKKQFRSRINADFLEKKILDETKKYYCKAFQKYTGGYFTEVRESMTKRDALKYFFQLKI